MCKENKELFLILLFAALLACAAGALRGEEPELWYLISGTELRSIEEYKENRERERRNWLLQVQLLNTEADILYRESINLNGQLAQARALNRRLETSFNVCAQGWLIQASLKNGETAELKEKKAQAELEKERYKGRAKSRLIIIIAGAALIVLYIAFKVCRFFRIIP